MRCLYSPWENANRMNRKKNSMTKVQYFTILALHKDTICLAKSDIRQIKTAVEYYGKENEQQQEIVNQLNTQLKKLKE